MFIYTLNVGVSFALGIPIQKKLSITKKLSPLLMD